MSEVGATTIHTHCRYCISFCGIDVELDRDEREVVSIKPDRLNPYSWQDFCRKGMTAGEVRNHPNRLKYPMRRVGERYERATYAEALDDIATRMRRIIDAHGPDSVGSYHGNPMSFSFYDTVFYTGLLEAIGTGNRFWVSSVDQNALHLVQKQMYGSDLLGLGGDVDECDYFLLCGMDPSVSKFGWVESVPNGWNRMLDRCDRGARLVIVDPRRSASAERADLHVAIRPGGDWAFLLAVLKVIFDEGLTTAPSAVAVTGLQTVRRLVADADLESLAQRCAVAVPQIEDVARGFATARTAMCVTHTGVAHNEGGALGEWLGHLLNIVTDRIDVPGGKRYERGVVSVARVFSMMSPASEHRSRLRDLPAVAGYHALAELPDEITTPGPGQIRAMLIASGNPVVSGPDGGALDQALSELDLLVAVDLVQRESHRHADWLIPGTHWLERGELNPGISGIANTPFVQMSRKVVPAPEGIMEEWEFFLELALRLKRPLFGFRGVNTFANASRALARVTKRPQLGLNGEWVTRGLVAAGRRVSYRTVAASAHGLAFAPKRYGDFAAALMTDDGTVHAAPQEFVDECRRMMAQPLCVDPEYPFVIINRRHRESMNSWISESPSLFMAERSNNAEVDARDADELGLADGEIVRLVSRTASIEVPVQVTEGGRRGVITLGHGWGSRIFDPHTGSSRSYGTNKNLLVSNAVLDPLSQTPAFNSTAVKIERMRPADARAADEEDSWPM